jgi:hypothetical protein
LRSEPPSDDRHFGAALLIAKDILAVSGGVVVACLSGAPTLGGTLPYKDIGFRLNRVGISVHLFAIADGENSFLAYVTLPPYLTGGTVHYYSAPGPRVCTHLFESLTRDYMWDASMKLRSSPGINVVGVLGGCTLRDYALCFPVMPCRHGIGFELGVEGDLRATVAVFQCAVLWTDAAKRRIVRVMTFVLPTSDRPGMVRGSLDEAAAAAFLLKKSASLTGDVGAAQGMVRKQLAQMAKDDFVSIYHLVHSLLGARFMRGAEVPVDDRFAEAVPLRSMSVTGCLLFLYPRMFAVDVDCGTTLPLCGESFGTGGIMLVHAVDGVYVWVGRDVNADTLSAYFGGQEVPSEVPRVQTEENERLHKLIAECWAISGKWLPVEIIPAGDQKEAVFRELLVDGRTEGGGDLDAFVSQMTAK